MMKKFYSNKNITYIFPILAILTISLSFMIGDTTDAFAVAQLRITADDTVNPPSIVTITDDGPGDVCSAAPGCIQFIVIPLTPLGCLDISLETAITKPFTGGAQLPSMNLAYSVTTNGLCHVKIEFTDTDFTAGQVTLTSTIGGTTEGETHYTADIDTGNQPFTATQNIFSLTHINPPIAFTGEDTTLLNPGGDYSITLEVEVWHQGNDVSSGNTFLTGISPPASPPEWSASTDSNSQGEILSPVDNPVDTVNIQADPDFSDNPFSGIWFLDDANGDQQTGACTGGDIDGTTGEATLTCDATGFGPFGVQGEETCWTIEITAPADYVPPTDTLDGTGIAEECFTLLSHSYFTGGGRVDVTKNTQADAFAISTRNNNVFTTFKITHGFELHCDPNSGPNNLEVNWLKSQFHLEELESVICNDDGSKNEPPPSTDTSENGPGPTTDVYNGNGFGRYNGECGAFAEWVFDDNGEPGKADHIVALRVTAAGGDVVLSVNPGELGVLDTSIAGTWKDPGPEHPPWLDLKVGNHQWLPHKAGTHGPTQTNPCPEVT